MNKEQIKKDVRLYISAHARVPESKFSDDSQLKKSPLHFDNTGLVFLALSLRGYIKSHNPISTIKAPEIRKDKFTVKKTIDLVIKRIQGK